MRVGKNKTLFDKLFAEIGMAGEDVATRPPSNECIYPDLPLVDALIGNWRAIEPCVEALADSLLSRIGSPAELILTGAQALGLPPIPRYEAPDCDLFEAILACGGTTDDRIPELRSRIDSLPLDVAQAAGRALAVFPRAALVVQQALGVGPDGWAASRTSRHPISPTELHVGEIAETDLGLLALAAVDLAEAATTARRLEPRSDRFEFSWLTSLGRIFIHGVERDERGKPNEKDLSDVAFLLSTGTDNAYGAGPGAGFPVAMAIHPGGGATFRNVPAAVHGIKLVFAGPASQFLSSGDGAGAAFYAISLIHCTGDGQVFRGRSFCQGAATCGISIVATDGRENVYECESYGQGFGGVRGFGCLVSQGGGCIYHAAVGAASKASPQDKRYNTSMAQGAAMGRRGVPPNDRGITEDPNFLPGGIGVLVNGGGDNSFTCGVFGQGAAYWHALGALVVYGPNNRFDGFWYTQGAAAHSAVGCLRDFGGASSFLTRLNHGQGAGHHYSVGILHTAGRGSSFRGGTQRLGVGHGNGMGLFAADTGRNRYVLSPESLAYVVENGDLRLTEPCYGFFYDGGKPIFVGDNVPRTRFWLRSSSAPFPLHLAAGHVPALPAAPIPGPNDLRNG